MQLRTNANQELTDLAEHMMVDAKLKKENKFTAVTLLSCIKSEL